VIGPRKRPADFNARAASVVADAVGAPKMTAAMSGRLGGRIGGPIGGRVRAERLTPERRSEIAKKAAEARWKRAV
jgi:hypothetical protein